MPWLITEITQEKSKLEDQCLIGILSSMALKDKIVTNPFKWKINNIKYKLI
jgi:hypothetical protein